MDELASRHELLFAAHWCTTMLGRPREQWSESSLTIQTSITLNAIGTSFPVHRLAPNVNDKMCRKWKRDGQRDPWAMRIIQCALPKNTNSSQRYNVLHRLSLWRRAIVVCNRQIYSTKHRIYKMSGSIVDTLTTRVTSTTRSFSGEYEESSETILCICPQRY